MLPFWIVVVQLLACSCLALAMAVVPLAARRAGSTAWRVHAVLVALCAVSLIAVLGHWIYDGMVSWAHIVSFCVALFLLPPIVASWGARAAATRWPSHRWLVAFAAVIAVLLVAGLVGRHLEPLPDVINATM